MLKPKRGRYWIRFNEHHLPSMQLLMVLPPASKNLLPDGLQPLMMDPQSPIADFYPRQFNVDGEGKRADWEAVVLLPFVDMARLVHAYEQVAAALPSVVQACNKPGKIYIFVHAEGHHEQEFCQSTLPDLMANVSVAHSKAEALDPKKPLQADVAGFTPKLALVRPPSMSRLNLAIRVIWPEPVWSRHSMESPDGRRCHGMQGCLSGANAPQVGWPTLKLLPFSTELKAININVLGITSKKKTRLFIPDYGAEVAETAATRLGRGICYSK